MDPATAYLVGQGILGAGSAASNYAVGSSNYTAQKHNLEWQQKAQRITWAREDNAAQRRAKDLAKAGLSKTLAAGQVAQTSTPVHTQAPQRERGAFDIAGNFMNITQTMAQSMLTLANATKAREDAKYQESLNLGNKAQKELDLLTQNNATAKAMERSALSQAGLNKQKADTEFWNRYWAINAKLPTNASGWSQFVGAFGAQIVGLQQQTLEEYKAGNRAYMDTMAKWENAVENAVRQAAKESRYTPPGVTLPIGGR